MKSSGWEAPPTGRRKGLLIDCDNHHLNQPPLLFHVSFIPPHPGGIRCAFLAGSVERATCNCPPPPPFAAASSKAKMIPSIRQTHETKTIYIPNRVCECQSVRVSYKHIHFFFFPPACADSSWEVPDSAPRCGLPCARRHRLLVSSPGTSEPQRPSATLNLHPFTLKGF